MYIIFHIEYLDDRILTGLLQFLAFASTLFIVVGISGIILTFLARLIAYIDPWRILRLGLLLPLHISTPLFLFYNLDEIGVHGDAPAHVMNNIYDTLPGKEMHEKQAIFLNQHKEDAFIFFVSCLIVLSISIYLLRYWKLSANRKKN